MLEKVITEKVYDVHYYEIDYKKRVLVTSLIDYFNDVAIFQGEHIGIGINYLLNNNIAWMLYKWDININKYPVYGDKIIVGTEPYGAKKFYAYRKFYVLNSKKEVIATANSIWILIDIKKRKPIRMPKELIKFYGIDMDSEISTLKIKNIDKVSNPNSSVEFRVRYSDIDTNGHVNNEKYAAWMIESVPLDIALNYTLKNIKIIYKKETKYGDNIKAINQVVSKGDTTVIIHKIEKEDGKELTLGETIWEKN